MSNAGQRANKKKKKREEKKKKKQRHKNKKYRLYKERKSPLIEKTNRGGSSTKILRNLRKN